VMKAIWLENQTIRYRDDCPVPRPAVGEALIKIRLAGICGTDLEMCRGYYPFTGIPGHEFVGDVVAAPDALEWVGQRVTGEITIACGTCALCRIGKPKHCLNSRTLGMRDYPGVFAETIVLPVVNLHAVPAGVTDEQAVFTEPLAAALEIQEQVSIHPDSRVLVIGAGRLGLLVSRCLGLTGCHLSVVARQPRACEILTQWGIQTVDASQVLPASADVVVEATGAVDGFDLAARAVRPTGTLVMKSTFKGEVSVNFSRLVVNEVTLVGSRCGPFEPALRLLEKLLVDPALLIDASYPLEKGEQAFAHAARPGMLKVLIKP
jgi:threonine dehydrogenase-like Zn-dependent dehydrogenase